jgi:hypothetical protein
VTTRWFNGPTLRYGPEKAEDQYGGLGQAQLDAFEDWATWEITNEAFDEVWSQAG